MCILKCCCIVHIRYFIDSLVAALRAGDFSIYIVRICTDKNLGLCLNDLTFPKNSTCCGY